MIFYDGDIISIFYGNILWEYNVMKIYTKDTVV